MVGVADNVARLSGQSIRNWKAILTSNGDMLSGVSIQHRIFHRYSVDSLSSLPFIIILIPLSLALNSTSYGYLILKETPINHLLHVDDMKLYGMDFSVYL